eukprot:1137110-Pelagomonas_calceolata.AAC.2
MTSPLRSSDREKHSRHREKNEKESKMIARNKLSCISWKTAPGQPMQSCPVCSSCERWEKRKGRPFLAIQLYLPHGRLI